METLLTAAYECAGNALVWTSREGCVRVWRGWEYSIVSDAAWFSYKLTGRVYQLEADDSVWAQCSLPQCQHYHSRSFAYVAGCDSSWITHCHTLSSCISMVMHRDLLGPDSMHYEHFNCIWFGFPLHRIIFPWWPHQSQGSTPFPQWALLSASAAIASSPILLKLYNVSSVCFDVTYSFVRICQFWLTQRVIIVRCGCLTQRVVMMGGMK